MSIRESIMKRFKCKGNKDIEFTEVEKKVLESVITKVNAQESLREAASQLAAAYENYTEEQLDKELDNIENDIEYLATEMKETDYEDREDLLDQIHDIQLKLSAMDDFLTDEQLVTSEQLKSMASDLEDVDYEGENHPVDPYVERGLRRSDFY